MLTAPLRCDETEKNPYAELVAHYEIEHIYGHDLLEAYPLLTQSYDNESQTLGTLYATVGYNHVFIDDTLEFDLQTQGNVQYNKEEYRTPLYLNTFYNEEINTAFLSQAALTYYSDDFLISAGRELVAYDFLIGSVDGVSLFYLNDYVGATLFWFINYYDFQYNYFNKREHINSDQGVYGLYLQSQETLDNMIISCYAYSTPNALYIVGSRIDYALPFMNLHGSYTYSNTYAQNSYARQERFMRAFADLPINDAHSMEAGYSITGEEGLYTILQLGSHPFSPFYLNNNLQKQNSENGYLSYLYSDDTAFDLHITAGYTWHDALSLDRLSLTTVRARSFEIDLYSAYHFSDEISLELSYNRLYNDEQALFLFDQELLYANVVLQWQ